MGSCATTLQKEKKKSQQNTHESAYQHIDDEKVNINQSVTEQITMHDAKQQDVVVIESSQNKTLNEDKDIHINETLQKHQNMRNNADIEVELTVFANLYGGNDFDKCESENCISLRRLITAST
eukprot:382567_1